MIDTKHLFLGTWNIFVVTHKHIFDWMYQGDPDFSQENFKFVNVSDHRLDKQYRDKYNVINQNELPGYRYLGPQYAESEAIYNLYKSKYYRNKSLHYIGFLHYDKELVLNNGARNISERINNYLNSKTKAHICFSKYGIAWAYGIKYYVNGGLNLYDYILNDYNAYFQTNYTLQDLLKRVHINLDSCFLIDVKTFEKMMEFCSAIIETKKIDAFVEHKMPAVVLERYYGVFLSLEYNSFLDLTLPHHHLNI